MILELKIETESGIPVYIQLEEHIRMLIKNGTLKAGELMPTTRKLAVDLGINVNTVARIYKDLRNSGHLTMKRGVGTFVSSGIPAPIKKKEYEEIESKASELIELSKKSGLTVSELNQIIATKWKE